MNDPSNLNEATEVYPDLPRSLERNLYDPLETAKAEGEAYGVAISGKYRAKFIIRITFLVGGFAFFILGAGYLFYNVGSLTNTETNIDLFIVVVHMIVVLAITLGGLAAMIKAIQNGRKKEHYFDQNETETTFWICSNCQEQVEDQYGSCWNCLEQRE